MSYKKLAKPALYLLGAFLVFRLYKLVSAPGGIMAALSPSDNNQAALLEKTKKSVEGTQINTTKTSKTMEELKQRADSCFQAFFGSPFLSMGTDEKLLFDSLSGLNLEDLRSVYKYFGVRKASAFLGFVSVFEGDLFGWLQAELSGKELIRAKEIFKGTGLWS